MSHIEFITAAFGERCLSQLPPFLYSISQTHPDSGIVLLWEDFPREYVEMFVKSIPKLKAVETKFNYSSDLAKRISSKTLAWSTAVRTSKAKNILLIDIQSLDSKNG